MSVRNDGDAITDVIVRCRALWLLTDVPETTVDEMAAELEAHLREHVAAGGMIEDVVGALTCGSSLPHGAASSALGPAARPRASGDQRAAHDGGDLRRRRANPRLDARWPGRLARSRERSGLARRACGRHTLVTRPEVLARILISHRRWAALLAAVMLLLVVVPLGVPVLARTLLLFGPALLAWPWWASLLLVVAAVASLAGTRPQPPSGDRS